MAESVRSPGPTDPRARWLHAHVTASLRQEVKRTKPRLAHSTGSIREPRPLVLSPLLSDLACQSRLSSEWGEAEAEEQGGSHTTFHRALRPWGWDGPQILPTRVSPSLSANQGVVPSTVAHLPWPGSHHPIHHPVRPWTAQDPQRSGYSKMFITLGILFCPHKSPVTIVISLSRGGN